ncbi:DsbA family protein [Microbacterium sp. cx-55]|uniref:DsbA family protein n=1 Tax=Microbacterium sp. cx-55 TaxID=2875948 RepID=UPI001CBE1E75|nr:thioredoxin domain-containing protein [Microbacterium sp. cx-55]UGB34101.1 DsbA family protein [Microbacterium sp. cx-55]
MRNYVKPLWVTGAVVVVLVLVAAIWMAVNRPAPAESGAGPASVVREDSRVLDRGGEGAVTVVEFLDFECEACGAAYPYVEQLRADYVGRITYVVRYFPLPGHVNSTNAALAAEAAGQQGAFEEMYHALFQSQADWGEAGESRADVFRTFAEDLGLDMTEYDRAVADPDTLARVQADFADGRALGVSGTPTFFVNGRQLTELTQWSDVTDAIDAELAP